MKSLLAVAVLVAACFLVVGVAHAADAAPKADAAVKAAPAPAPAPAPAASQPAIDPGKVVTDLFAAAKAKEWRVVVGLVLTLLIWGYRRFVNDFVAKKVGKYAPLIVVGLGLLSSLAFELIKSPFSWSSFLVGGLLTSATAITFWSTLAKFILPTKAKE
jgi:hypothetical protein